MLLAFNLRSVREPILRLGLGTNRIMLGWGSCCVPHLNFSYSRNPTPDENNQADRGVLRYDRPFHLDRNLLDRGMYADRISQIANRKQWK